MVSIAILLAVVSFSYAYIKYDTEEQGINVLGTDCISISMTDVTNSITLRKAYPMTDVNGEATDPYTFTLTNNCSVGVDYNINLRVENEGIAEEQKMPVEGNIATKVDEQEKVILSSENKVPKTDTQTEDKYTIGSGTLEPKGTVQHSVKIWLDETAGNDTQNKTFKSKVIIEATQNQIVEKTYTEELLNGADPVLNGDLVAVKVDPNTGAVTKADTTEEWYKYGEKRWANAIIPTEEAKEAVEQLSIGETIDEDQIESYFVWIPKYKYKIQTLGVSETGKEQAFDIVFGTEDTKDATGECKTPEASKASGSSGNCTAGEYMTHPAFLAFGGNGLWVGKFETGYEGASSKSDAQQGTANSEKVVIKPNQYSWRSINVSSAFTTAKGYQESLKSHMMKNTEWGAVAYLTQSIYGRCTSGSCTEITINNNSNYVTGYAAKDRTNSTAVSPGQDSTSSVNYTNKDSGVASTTGNHTGIYDMSGGAYEYVMGVMYAKGDSQPSSGYSSNSNSGFNGPYTETTGGSNTTGIDFPDAKYYDVYKYGTSSSDYTRRILGDATTETKGWYSDYGYFVNSGSPWVRRGGLYSYGTDAGVFSFNYGGGSADSYYGFRLVLAM